MEDTFLKELHKVDVPDCVLIKADTKQLIGCDSWYVSHTVIFVILLINSQGRQLTAYCVRSQVVERGKSLQLRYKRVIMITIIIIIIIIIIIAPSFKML